MLLIFGFWKEGVARVEKSQNRVGRKTGQTLVNRLRNTHDIIDIVSIRQKFYLLLLSRKAASSKVCSPEPEVSFKPPAVCRKANRPFSSKGSQRFVSGWILICEGVDAPVSWVLQSRLTKESQRSAERRKEVKSLDKLFIGIDVGSRDNAVHIMLPDGTKHRSFSVGNNLGGSQAISKNIVSAMTEKGLRGLEIGIEATGVYGDGLMCFLNEDGAVGQFEKRLYILNPKQVEKFKQAYSDLPKNDSVDAFVIADSLRFGRIKTNPFQDDYRYKALQTLTRSRYHAVQSLTREKQRFMNCLFRKCSGLAQEKIFSSNYGKAALAVFEEFETPDDIVNIDVEQLAAFIAQKGKNRSPRPVEIAKEVQAAARGSYRLPKTVNDSVNQVLSISISSMRAMQAQIKALDKEIERQFENIPNTLTSIKGIGPVFSAGIIAEVGDVNRFTKGQAGLAKYAGLVWKEHKSGTFEGQNTRMIKSGNRFLKYYLCEAAMSLVCCDAEYRRYYDLKYKEVNKYQHKRALALTARKFVRLVFRLLKDNRLYISA
jgi:transposase